MVHESPASAFSWQHLLCESPY